MVKIFLEDRYNNLYDTALNFIKLGNIRQAKYLLEEIAKKYSNSEEIFHLLGVVESQLGNINLAEKYANLAINFSKNPNPLHYSNLGEILRRKGDINKAIEILKKALEIDNNYTTAKYNLANIFRITKNYYKAIDLYNECIKNNKNDHLSLYNMANCFFEIGDYENTIKFYDEIIKIKPDFLEIYYSFAYVYENLGRFDDAIKNYTICIDKKLNNKEVNKRIAICYEELGKIDKAKKFYKKYLEIDKDNIGIKMHISFLSEIIFSSTKEIDIFRIKVEENIIKYKNKASEKTINSFVGNIPSFIYHGTNNKKIKENFANMFERSFIRHKPKYIKKEKIRLGFFVSHGQEGIFSNLMKEIINNFSEKDFEIYIISLTFRSQIKVKEQFNNDYIKYSEIPKDFLDLITIIKKIELDILYHWEVGTTFANYILPFFKLAPIQCTSIGWPETTGIKEIDYFISNEFMEIENAQEHYTEKVLKINSLPLFYKKMELTSTFTLSHFDIDEKYNIYSCLQNIRKIHPDFDILVKGILEKDKNALIVFVEDREENTTELLKFRFRTNLPEFYDRILFLPRLSYQEYLNFINHSEVILDTLYYAGGNTSMEAFAIGTPTITFPSVLQRSRFTYALYKKMDINDCISNSIENYIELAVKIANDKELRKNISDKIKDKNKILFDNYSVVKELEDLFKEMIYIIEKEK